MNYVTGVVMQFSQMGSDKVSIKARGKLISRAVDIAEVSSKRFLRGQVKVEDIIIGSEEFTNDDGRLIRVSSIEIVMKKVTESDDKHT